MHRPDYDWDAGCIGYGMDLARLIARHGERLLAQHGLLAGLTSRDHLGGVEPVRTADRHDIDGRVIEQGVD